MDLQRAHVLYWSSKDTYKQVRDVAVSVSLSADTAAAQADGAIAHSAPKVDLDLALSGPLRGL